MATIQEQAYQAVDAIRRSLQDKRAAEETLAPGQLSPEQVQAQTKIIADADAAVTDNCNQLIGLFAQLAELETPAVPAGASDGQRLASMPVGDALSLVAELHGAVAWASQCAAIAAVVRTAQQVGSWWWPYAVVMWAWAGLVVFISVAYLLLCVFAPLGDQRWPAVIVAVVVVIYLAGLMVLALKKDSAQRRSDVGHARRQMQDSAQDAGQLADRMHGAAMGRFQQLFEDIQRKLATGSLQVNAIVGPFML